MSVSIYPVLEREVVGYDGTFVNGTALAHAVYHSNLSARTALDSFISISPHEVAAMEGYYLPDNPDPNPEHEPAPPDFRPPAEVWHEPAIGLIAVREALQVLREGREELNTQENRSEWVVSDLEAIEWVLLLAQKEQVRFHFQLDF